MLDPVEAFDDLTFVGLVGLLDPPRAPVREALRAARAAGVRVVMATGDQAPTARAVAEVVGVDAARVKNGADVASHDDRDGGLRELLAAGVIARASPADKLRLLRLHQRAGEVVAMLGDGVNDAPALKQADIGVAMGRRGTQVARQAADMVLEDDELATVVVAIEQGRVIFANLRAFVVYLIGCNLAEILVIGLATAIGWPLPVLPLQILYLNLLTDVFPAVALGVGEGDPAVMQRPPRSPGEAFLTRKHWRAIVAHGALITVAVLGAHLLAREWLGLGDAAASTLAFAVLGFSQLLHVFDMADPRASAFDNEVTRNPWVKGAVALCTVLLLAGLFAPGLGDVLGSVALPLEAWLIAAIASPLPLLATQLGRVLRHGRASESAEARLPEGA